MNQYKMCMGMWNSFSPLIHINISQEQQRDKKKEKKRINLKTMNGETIKTFFSGIKQASKGVGALKVTGAQPQQVSDPASFQ